MSKALVQLLLGSTWAIRPDILSAAVEAAQNGRAAGDAQDDYEQTTDLESALQRGRPRGGNGGAVAVIGIQGIIRPKPSLLAQLFGLPSGSLANLRSTLREAVSDEEVGSIVLDVDSPGGRVDQVPETADEIRAAARQKPVVAVANSQAASAAYWLSAQASELMVTPSGQVGSIGVIAVHEEISKLAENIGVTITVMRAGQYKAEANPFEPLTDEAQSYIQGQLDSYYDMFTGAVAKGRGVAKSTVKGEDFGQGRMLMARDAIKKGVADSVGTLEDAVGRAAKLSSTGGGTRADTDDAPPAEADGSASSLAAAGADPSKRWVRDMARGRVPTSHQDPAEPSRASE